MRMIRQFMVVLLGLWASEVRPLSAESPGAIRFNRDIRPILSDACFACHGPDRNARKADLRLDTPEGAARVKEGRQPLVPGHPESSALIQRITSADPDEVMPPVKTGKKLTAAQIELLKRWVAEGGRYEGHWAFLSPVRSEPPLPADGSSAWNPIDRFVLDRLHRAGMAPSPEADRRTLIRRLSFDLTGLPPEPSEVERFVRSRDPRAYEALVERLLASPHFGERMAIPWLDLVRYADTIGYHGDLPISVWPYRDYVIQAFNRNIPFDQFTREQLAGDLLEGATPLQKTASGYNRLNRISSEGGVQDKEFLAKYASDRVRTTATVWMGATLACAECHDHKFDPFTTRDFYQFSAFFADLKEKGFYDKGFSENDWGSKVRLATPAQSAALRKMEARITSLQAEIDRVGDDLLEPAREAWEGRMLALDRLGLLEWNNQTPLTAVSSGGASLVIGTNRTITAGGPDPDQDLYTVTFKPGPGVWRAIRLETLVDEMFPGNRIARGGTTFVVTDFSLTAEEPGSGAPTVHGFAHVSSDMQGEGFPALAMIDGKADTGWAITTGHSREHQAAFRLSEPMITGPDTQLNVRITQASAIRRATIGRFRLALSGLERPSHEKATIPDDVLKAIKVAAADRKEDQKNAIAGFYRKVSPELEPLHWRMARLVAERGFLQAAIPTSLVSERAEMPRTTRILPRGNWMDESGEVVKSGVPHFMEQLSARREPSTRLDLADWLASPANPMTARAFVNRFWRQFFGAGFTRTPEDLGVQGDWPSHPELLDWLACEFMEPTISVGMLNKNGAPHRWDVKHLARLIVTSKTYRQSSVPRPGVEDRDPSNRLLSRQNRFRLEAELIRDNALEISGLLVKHVGGPSVRPYQPEGYFASLNFPKREYVLDRGANLHRRGIYTHWQRTFLHPSLLAFDAPSREECTAARTVSNTPLQALVLLNDPAFVEAARALAVRLAPMRGSLESRMAFGWERATGRPPQAGEVRVLKKLFDQEFRRFEADPAAASALAGLGDSTAGRAGSKAELAAWTSVARCLLNLHETITRP